MAESITAALDREISLVKRRLLSDADNFLALFKYEHSHAHQHQYSPSRVKIEIEETSTEEINYEDTKEFILPEIELARIKEEPVIKEESQIDEEPSPSSPLQRHDFLPNQIVWAKLTQRGCYWPAVVLNLDQWHGFEVKNDGSEAWVFWLGMKKSHFSKVKLENLLDFCEKYAQIIRKRKDKIYVDGVRIALSVILGDRSQDFGDYLRCDLLRSHSHVCFTEDDWDCILPISIWVASSSSSSSSQNCELSVQSKKIRPIKKEMEDEPYFSVERSAPKKPSRQKVRPELKRNREPTPARYLCKLGGEKKIKQEESSDNDLPVLEKFSVKNSEQFLTAKPKNVRESTTGRIELVSKNFTDSERWKMTRDKENMTPVHHRISNVEMQKLWSKVVSSVEIDGIYFYELDIPNPDQTNDH